MGYYASAGGDIMLKKPLTENDLERAIDILSEWYEVHSNDARTDLDLYYDGKYYGDVLDCLNEFTNEFSNVIQEATIYFSGEDDECWKFIYNPLKLCFEEIGSRVIYDDEAFIENKNKCSEFIGQIIDTFEDFLEERGVCFSSNSPVSIHGYNYDSLKYDLEDMMRNWRIIK